MRAPERAIKLCAGLRDTFCKGVVHAGRGRDALDINIDGEDGGDHEDDVRRDLYAAHALVARDLLFGFVFHKDEYSTKRYFPESWACLAAL